MGFDNLLRTDRHKLTAKFTVVNLANKEALYNFLSTLAEHTSSLRGVTRRSWDLRSRRLLKKPRKADSSRAEARSE